MIIRKPEYYDEFVCTANKCPLTCCREWKIEVDDETNEKWKKLQAPENVYPVRKNMSQYTQKKDNMRVIALNKKHICPFLNEQSCAVWYVHLAMTFYQRHAVFFQEKFISF